MKHKIDGPVDVNVNHKHDHEFDKEEIDDVIDKVTESALIIIGAYTASHILRKWLG